MGGMQDPNDELMAQCKSNSCPFGGKPGLRVLDSLESNVQQCSSISQPAATICLVFVQSCIHIHVCMCIRTQVCTCVT